MIYDASGTYDYSKMNTSRGILQVKIAGSDIFQLFGMLSLGKYVQEGKTKLLCFFIVCLLFTILLVSRQHIVAYTVIGLYMLIKKVGVWKKVLIMSLSLFLAFYVLPNTKIYQNLSDLTSKQLEENAGMKDDVRTNAAIYFVTKHPANVIQKFFGHGECHFESGYGKQMYGIIDKDGFVLADVGLASIYFYFGILGLLFFVKLLYWTWHNKSADVGAKYFVYYCFATSIMSHTLDTAILSIVLACYIIIITRTNEMKHNVNVI